MSDDIVYSSDPEWGKPGTPRQPEPVRLSFRRGAKGAGVTRIERLVMHPTLKEQLLARLKKSWGAEEPSKTACLNFKATTEVVWK
jgi:hypothetical protein